jgi:DNA-binding MarR family transcriptional regulator
MADRLPPAALDLYALVTFLHSRCNRDLFDAITDSHLNFNQLRLLDRLRGAGRNPTNQQVSAMLGVRPASSSRLVEDLAERGYVQRHADERDGRRTRIQITPAGERAVEELHAARLVGMANFVDELSAGELEQLQRALKTLLKRDAIAARRPSL